MPRYRGETDDWGRGFGESDETPTIEPPRKKGGPAWRMMTYFRKEWMQILRQRTDFKEIRTDGGNGPVLGYLNSKFFKPSDGRVYEESEVREFIDVFMYRVLTGDIRIKPGQSAWQCFCGSWGYRRNDSSMNYDYDAARKKFQK